MYLIGTVEDKNIAIVLIDTDKLRISEEDIVEPIVLVQSIDCKEVVALKLF